MLGRARLTPSSPRGLSLTKRSRALRASSLTRILPNPVSGGRSPGPASHTYPREAPRRVSPKEERHERGTHHSPGGDWGRPEKGLSQETPVTAPATRIAEARAGHNGRNSAYEGQALAATITSGGVSARVYTVRSRLCNDGHGGWSTRRSKACASGVCAGSHSCVERLGRSPGGVSRAAFRASSSATTNRSHTSRLSKAACPRACRSPQSGRSP
jgi:hypothetical protein